jgi:carbon starvation protein CstA
LGHRLRAWIIADHLVLTKGTHLKPTLWLRNGLFVIALYSYQIDFSFYGVIFSWANQSISAIASWIGTVYLYKRKTLYQRLIPAFSYKGCKFFLYDPTIGFDWYSNLRYYWIVIAVLITILFF